MKHSTAFVMALAISLSIAGAAPASSQDAKPEEVHPLQWKDLLGKGSMLQFYGFVRADVQYDDSRFNDPQIPGFVQSEDPTAPASVGAEEDDSEFAIHARLTRIGANFKAPPVEGFGNPDLSGNIEIDFYNIGLNDNDSRSAIRMRRAFLNLDWGDWSLLAGQEWDIFSPLLPAVNHDLSMWGAGNLGDRRPQVRVQYDHAAGPGTFTFTGGLGLAGAVDSPTVEGGLRAGENSGSPLFAARAGYAGKTGAGGAYQLGLSGHVETLDFDADGAGPLDEEDYDSSSVSIDFKAPLYRDRWSLMGEAFTGQNLADVRGGIFQAVSMTGEEIDSEGGWLELVYQATPDCSLHAGYAMDDPEDSDLDANGRSENDIAYVAVRRRWGVFSCGLEYLNWTTEYVDLDDGDANRLQAFLAYNF
jgi:hypothetical protein